MKRLLFAAVAAGMLAIAAPASAVPMTNLAPAATSSDAGIVQVQYRDGRRGMYRDRGFRRHHGWHQRRHWDRPAYGYGRRHHHHRRGFIY